MSPAVYAAVFLSMIAAMILHDIKASLAEPDAPPEPQESRTTRRSSTRLTLSRRRDTRQTYRTAAHALNLYLAAGWPPDFLPGQPRAYPALEAA